MFQESTSTLWAAVSAVCSVLLLLSVTAAVTIVIVCRIKIRKQQPKDVQAKGYRTHTEKLSHLTTIENCAYALMKVPVYLNDAYTVGKMESGGLEVNMLPNKEYYASKNVVTGYPKFQVYPNEVYAVSKGSEEPVYEIVV